MLHKLCYSFAIVLQLCIVNTVHVQAQVNHTLSGFVYEKGSKEPLIGVTIYIPELKNGTVSNSFGFYSLSLPEGIHTLVFSYVGYEPQTITIQLQANQRMDVELVSGLALDEVEVIGRKDTVPLLSETVQMSQLSLRPATVKDVPMLLGEKDVLKTLQLMPGVQSGSEGSAGLYVRGGGPDQNLIMLDDAIVYNAFHLFGFFSLFNGDALKTIELTKGGFPARFGGRLSSVLEMRSKEGNKERIKGEGGIGLLSSRLTVEGPIWKDKTSFIVSGRRSYIDLVTRPFMPSDEQFGYFFYDGIAKLNHTIDEKNKLYLSGYFGRDQFYARNKNESFDSRFGTWWGNQTGTLRWNHIATENLFLNTSIVYSQYRFKTFYKEKDLTQNKTGELNYRSGIEDWTLKTDADYFLNRQHTLKCGVQTLRHIFTPMAFTFRDDFNPALNDRLQSKYYSNESAVYIEDVFRHNERWLFNNGLRLVHFYLGGEHLVRPEPRLATRYKVKPDLALKGSFAVMNQFVHLLSNTSVGLPTDLWVPSTAKVRPQQSWQVAAGVAKDDIEHQITYSVEGYYKKMDRVIQYKEGASFFVIDDPSNPDARETWEDKITFGQGYSTGLEMMVQKHVGKFTGWVGYTLSWTRLQFDSLNFGRSFWARYDRRHDISIVGIYKPHPGITLSASWVYGTGNAITMPLAELNVPTHTPMPTGERLNQNYFFGTQIFTQYTDRNAYRMAAFHKMDISVQWTRKTDWGERTWELSVYNAYNRKNPFFYYIQNNKLKQFSLFPLLPSLSYNFKF